MFFSRNSHNAEAAGYVRRIIDLTSPNRPIQSDARAELRYNRSIPVVMCPWHKNKADLRLLAMGFTTDLSDSGLGVIHVNDTIETDSVLFSFILPPEETDVWFFVGEIETRDSRFGFHRIGISMAKALRATDSKVQKFRYVANELISSTYAETVS